MVKLAPNAGKNIPNLRPGLTPEADESQMIALAVNLVRQRLLDGTASSQETTHYLKLATTEARLKNKLLETNAELAIAKKEALESTKRSEEMFREAIAAFKSYTPSHSEPVEDDYDEY